MSNIYGVAYSHRYHLTINDSLGYFTGLLADQYELACITIVHNETDKVQDATIECSNFDSSGDFSESSKNEFILYNDGGSVHRYSNSFSSGGNNGTLNGGSEFSEYGAYFYDKSSGEFTLSYMAINSETSQTELNTFEGVLKNGSAMIGFSNGSQTCQIQ